MTNQTISPKEEVEEQGKMTPEEYAKAREAAKKHLQKEIAYLKIEEQYEKLQADIEEHKTRRITMIAQQARYYGAQQEQGAKPPISDDPEEHPSGENPLQDLPQEEKPKSKPKRKLQKNNYGT